MKPMVVFLAVALASMPETGASADEFDEPAVVESIVVKGSLPGPAWWRVSDADSTVHILVIPEAAPADLNWDRTVLDARMKRARLLIMPAEVTVGLTQIPKLVRTYKGELVDEKELEPSLPEPLRGRFVAARTANGMSAAQFSKLRPAYAAERLERQLRARRGIVTGKVADAISATANRHRVRQTKPLVKFKPERVTWTALDLAAGLRRERDCLDQTLQTMVPVVAAQRQSALDWAGGDVRALLTLPRLSHRSSCDNDLLARVYRTHRPELLQSQIKAIEAALNVPGETIAVVRPGLLLSEDGVLLTLKARGYDLRTPANISEP